MKILTMVSAIAVAAMPYAANAELKCPDLSGRWLVTQWSPSWSGTSEFNITVGEDCRLTGEYWHPGYRANLDGTVDLANLTIKIQRRNPDPDPTQTYSGQISSDGQLMTKGTHEGWPPAGRWQATKF